MQTATRTDARTDARTRGLLAAAALTVAAAWPAGQAEDGPVLCPFRIVTGLPCPLCGMTRSFVYTLHGRFDDAFAAHLFGPALVVLAALWVLAWRATTWSRASTWGPASRWSRASTWSWADPGGWVRGRARPWFVAVLAAWAVYAVGRVLLV